MTRISDSGFDDALHHIQTDTVAPDGRAIDSYLQIGLTDYTVGDDRSGFDLGHILQEAFEVETQPFDAGEVGPSHLYPQRRSHTALEHDNARRNGLETRRRGRARDLGRIDNSIPDVIR